MPNGTLANLRRKPQFEFFLLILAVLLVRTAAVVGCTECYQEDIDSYGILATNWAQSGTFGFMESDTLEARPTAFRPPLYPWLLSCLVRHGQISSSALACLHILLGLVTVTLTWAIGKRVLAKRPMLAALAVTVDPLLLRNSQLVMTETLATCLSVLVWWMWLVHLDRSASVPVCNSAINCQRENKCGLHHGISALLAIRQYGFLVLLGVLVGLSILTRPTAAPWALTLVCLVWFFSNQCVFRRTSSALSVMLGILICVVPWTLRNYALLGKPIWATSHGGYTLLLANNPYLYSHFSTSGPSRGWDAQPFHNRWLLRGEAVRHGIDVTQPEFWAPSDPIPSSTGRTGQSPTYLPEIEDDALAYSVAKATIQRTPMMFLISSIYRAGWFWAWWPYHDSFSLSACIIGMWYGGWSCLALVGLVAVIRSRQFKYWAPPLLLALVLTAAHSIYWSNMRMRSQLMTGVYLLAVFGANATIQSRTKTN